MLCFFLKKVSLNCQSPFWLFPVPQVATIVVLHCSVWCVCEGSLGIYSIILLPNFFNGFLLWLRSKESASNAP